MTGGPGLDREVEWQWQVEESRDRRSVRAFAEWSNVMTCMALSQVA